jgi:HPt (histidine-containing phosphotransfer) domain-containing protein
MSSTTLQLNREFLTSYYGEMVDEIGEIFQLFLNEIPNEVASVKLNLQNNKYVAAASVLHKIAPSFCNIGLPDLTTKIKTIEANLQEGNTEEVWQQINLFEEELMLYLPIVVEENERLANVEKRA